MTPARGVGISRNAVAQVISNLYYVLMTAHEVLSDRNKCAQYREY